MSTQQQDKQHMDQDQEQRQQLNAVLGKHVMHSLGQPRDLFSVQVRELWKDHYRVNVLRGLDAASVKVAHSFFVVGDGEGNVIASTPTIARQY